jgi:hypothetical protein
MTRSTSVSGLSAHNRDFWGVYPSVIATEAELAAAEANTAAGFMFDPSAVTAAEVAERMDLSVSTNRRYRDARKLYSYLVNGKLIFPGW